MEAQASWQIASLVGLEVQEGEVGRIIELVTEHVQNE